MIYVIAHKSPDLDSTVGAIIYAAYKNKKTNTKNYLPVTPGPLNKETGYILEKFGFDKPEILNSLAGKEVILVDHNEFSQAQDGVDEAKILEVVDHHKIDFHYNEPIIFETYPLGSSCSIVAGKYWEDSFELTREEASILLAGILVDTVITKSPTCTETDKEIIDRLSKISGIKDWRAFGMEIFKVRSDITEFSDDAILKNDFKDFNFKAGKFGIGQIETADLSVFAGREDALLGAMEVLRLKDGYHSIILFITDIIKEGSQFLVASGDEATIEKALGASLINGRLYIPGIMSRKKQVVPMFTQIFD